MPLDELKAILGRFGVKWIERQSVGPGVVMGLFRGKNSRGETVEAIVHLKVGELVNRDELRYIYRTLDIAGHIPH